MRRSEKEIKEQEEIENIIERADVCRIGLSDGNMPYIVAMNFGYKDNCLYFHCAKEGKKIDIIKRNYNACFEMDIDHAFVKPEGRPCARRGKYRSVIGFGKAFIVEDFEEISDALNIIIQHYGNEYYPFSKDELERVCIIKIEIGSITGKKSGY
ncbi:MAG: pyridoxamine 5'-phosphate oxidase family protein [Dehalococcoidia bacterium]|nr:MAG: pyridoxamine 5'-phosphate oxidase family protein [Dehalococcoidia bacterium]